MTVLTGVTSETFRGMLATDEDMPYILGRMDNAPDIAIDTETSGLNVRNGIDFLMGICIDVPGVSTYMPLRHPNNNIDKAKWLPYLVSILQTKPLIWHNRKFDYHSIKTLGVDPLSFKGLQYDTLLLATLNDEEVFSKELDFLCKRYLKLEKIDNTAIIKHIELFGGHTVPAGVYKDYGAWDAVLTRKLRDFLWPKIEQQELSSVYWDTELPFQTLLYDLEQRGVGVQTDFVARKAEVGNSRMATIRRELDGLNPASPLDLKRLLLDELELPVLAHTDSCEPCKNGLPLEFHEGKPSFNKHVMEDYDRILDNSNNVTARRVNEYRGWQKAVTSLYEPLLRKTGPDGRIRTEFHQHRAVTGRLSSSNPNLQQVPRGTDKPWNGDAKKSFIAGDGYEDYALYGWDYSQVEFRLAAAYGAESLLLAEFAKPDADPFSVLAPIVFGVLTPETRHYIKNGFVYPTLYGAGLRKIAATLGKEPGVIGPQYERFKDTIPGIIGVSNQVSRLIEQRGYVKYWDGRRRHIRDKRASYKGFNAVCQGGSAQLLKRAMLRIRREVEDTNCLMVLTVHDEITFLVRRDMIAEYEPKIIHCMTDWPQFGVNLSVEGKEWGKAA